MLLFGETIVAQHSIDVGRNESSFFVEPQYHPRDVQLTEGQFRLQVKYLATSTPLQNTSSFSNGYELVCFQCLSEQAKPLPVLVFSKSEFERNGNIIVCDPNTRPAILNFKSDRLHLQLRTVRGELAQLKGDGEILLGLTLLQVAQH